MVAAPLLMLPPVPSNPSAYRRGGERRLVAAPLLMLPPVPSNPSAYRRGARGDRWDRLPKADIACPTPGA